jgi:hypothetical protein
MPFKVLEKETFVYIAYKRDKSSDFNVYRNALEQFSKDDTRDIVVDFTRSEIVTEGEIAVLVMVLKQIQGTSRQLRIIAPSDLYNRFELRNLHKANNILLYNNHQTLLQSIN